MATFASNFTNQVDLPDEQDAAFTISQFRLDIATDGACDHFDGDRPGFGYPALLDPILLKDRIILADHDRLRPIMVANLAGHIQSQCGDFEPGA